MRLGKRLFFGGLAAATLALGGGAGAQTYQVTVQAPAVTTLPSGTLVFSFNAGSDTRAATATLGGFTYSADYDTTGGYTVFGSAVAPTGAGTAGTISNDTSQFANGFSANATPLGRRLVFTLAFSGPALRPTAPYATTGSDFAIQLLDTAGKALWTADPKGRVLDIPLNPDGTLGQPQTFGAGVVTVVATPEPSSVTALGGGAVLLLGLTMRARRRGRTGAARR